MESAVRTRQPIAKVLAQLLLLALLGLTACRRSEAVPQPDRDQVRVEVRPAARHTFRGVVPLTGELRPVREVALKSRIGGNVVELRFDEGDAVKKGELIARIEAVNQNAQLKSARAQVLLAEAQKARAEADLEKAERDRARIETLYAKGAADKRSLDDIHTAKRLAEVAIQTAAAQLLQAQAARDAAQNAVAETEYRAPFDGVIARRGISLNEYIDTMKNREIVTIVDNSAMELLAAVAADLAGGVVKGARVDFQVGALPGKTLSGEVISVSPSADPRTRTIRIRARLQNPDGLLKGGMYATGVVTVGGERSSIGVPAQAVHADQAGEAEGERQVVWRVKGGVAEKVAVRTGALDGDVVEVLSGLAEGDAVVVSSPAALRPGLAVLARTGQ
jgi:RND family efflux transporter MFP subunit